MSVDVDTPDDVKSGSSVIEATYERSMILEMFFGPRFGSSFTGEGVFVDLGGGRNVIVTLTGFGSMSPKATQFNDLPVRIYKLPWFGQADAYEAMRVAVERAKHESPKNVPLDMLPLMITFRKVQDPKTLERVDPQHFEAAFGPGYAVKAVTIQATEAPMNEQLGKNLEWFPGRWLLEWRNRGLDGSYFTRSVNPFMISAGDLKRGED